MEAIQQLLQSTGLSPDELIRHLAEFKAISEKTQTDVDVNKNPTVANASAGKCNEERTECANVSSTSDSLLLDELGNKKSEGVDVGEIFDGECVSTTELLCNNEVQEGKQEEWVGDVEDDRLSPKLDSNVNKDNSQLAITEGMSFEEELLISDKAKCIIETSTKVCESNHPEISLIDDTNPKNVSTIENKSKHKSLEENVDTLKNNLSPRETNEDTIKNNLSPMESNEETLISENNCSKNKAIYDVNIKKCFNDETLMSDVSTENVLGDNGLKNVDEKLEIHSSNISSLDLNNERSASDSKITLGRNLSDKTSNSTIVSQVGPTLENTLSDDDNFEIRALNLPEETNNLIEDDSSCIPDEENGTETCLSEKDDELESLFMEELQYSDDELDKELSQHGKKESIESDDDDVLFVGEVPYYPTDAKSKDVEFNKKKSLVVDAKESSSTDKTLVGDDTKESASTEKTLAGDREFSSTQKALADDRESLSGNKSLVDQARDISLTKKTLLDERESSSANKSLDDEAGDICLTEKTLLDDEKEFSPSDRITDKSASIEKPFNDDSDSSTTEKIIDDNRRSSTEQLSYDERILMLKSLKTQSADSDSDVKSSTSEIFSSERLSEFVSDEIQKIKQAEVDELLDLLKFKKSIKQEELSEPDDSQEIINPLNVGNMRRLSEDNNIVAPKLGSEQSDELNIRQGRIYISKETNDIEKSNVGNGIFEMSEQNTDIEEINEMLEKSRRSEDKGTLNINNGICQISNDESKVITSRDKKSRDIISHDEKSRVIIFHDENFRRRQDNLNISNRICQISNDEVSRVIISDENKVESSIRNKTSGKNNDNKDEGTSTINHMDDEINKVNLNKNKDPNAELIHFKEEDCLNESSENSKDGGRVPDLTSHNNFKCDEVIDLDSSSDDEHSALVDSVSTLKNKDQSLKVVVSPKNKLDSVSTLKNKDQSLRVVQTSKNKMGSVLTQKNKDQSLKAVETPKNKLDSVSTLKNKDQPLNGNETPKNKLDSVSTLKNKDQPLNGNEASKNKFETDSTLKNKDQSSKVVKTSNNKKHAIVDSSNGETISDVINKKAIDCLEEVCIIEDENKVSNEQTKISNAATTSAVLECNRDFLKRSKLKIASLLRKRVESSKIVKKIRSKNDNLIKEIKVSTISLKDNREKYIGKTESEENIQRNKEKDADTPLEIASLLRKRPKSLKDMEQIGSRNGVTSIKKLRVSKISLEDNQEKFVGKTEHEKGQSKDVQRNKEKDVDIRRNEEDLKRNIKNVVADQFDERINEDDPNGKINDDNLAQGRNVDDIEGRRNEDDIEGRGNKDGVKGRRHEDDIKGRRNSGGIEGRRNEGGIEGRTNNDGMEGRGNKDGIEGRINIDSFKGRRNEDDIEGRRNKDGIEGTRNEDDIEGRRNKDGIEGTRNEDDIEGRRNKDGIEGTRSDDDVEERRNKDRVEGRKNEDNIEGIRNDDILAPERNKDDLSDCRSEDNFDESIVVDDLDEAPVDVNKSIRKNIDVMKEIVNRICKSREKDFNKSADENVDKSGGNIKNMPSSSSFAVKKQSGYFEDTDLTMVEDEEKAGSPKDLDYEEGFVVTEEIDSGEEGSSISGPSNQYQKPTIDSTLTYETNSPTTHKPLKGCIRKRKETPIDTTPTKKRCTDSENIFEPHDDQSKEPVDMREKLFSQLQQLRQRKVNESPLVNIIHPIPKIYSKRVCKNLEQECGSTSSLGIQIVDVRGGVKVDEVFNRELSPIKLTKTQDITKIKGWRRKKLLVDNLNADNPLGSKDSSESSLVGGCSYSAKDVAAKNNDEGLNVFASNNLEGFLKQQKSLNISYNVPNLESSNHKIDYLDSTVLVREPLEKCTDKKRQYVLAENEDSNTLRQNSRSDLSKPRTLAEKRKLLNKTGESKGGMIMSSVYYRGARYLIPTKYKKPIYIGSRNKKKKKYKFVEVDEKRRHKPSILHKDTLDEKPRVSYKPGPLCKKQFLQESCRGDWESVLIKLPELKVEITPKFTKPVHPIARQFVKFETFEISEDRADFALSALIGNRSEKKFSFKVDYERKQENILMRKKVVTHEVKIEKDEPKIEAVDIPENINRVIATVMDDLIRCVENSEIENKIIGEDPDFTPYVQDVVIPSKYKEKKVKTEIIKGSARRTNLELKRLNVKVIEVNIEEDQKPAVDCKKAFCKLGCVCNSLNKTTLPSDHCGNYQCIFKCKCTKKKDTLKFVLPSGTDLLSECTVNRLQNEAKKDLAKVEKEFTQTVIHANNKTIVFGDSKDRKRRSLKQPKKYADYIETSVFCEAIEDVVKTPSPAKKITPQMRPCFVKVEKLNLEHVIPYCWAHNVYDCDCGCTTLPSNEEEEEEEETGRKDTVEKSKSKGDYKFERFILDKKKDNKSERERFNKSQKNEDSWAIVTNEEEKSRDVAACIESDIVNQRKLWRKKEKNCARTMGLSTSYYLPRNQTFTFKKRLLKKLNLQNSEIDLSVLKKWNAGDDYLERLPSDTLETIDDGFIKLQFHETMNKPNSRRKQVLVTREEVYKSEQNKKKQEEDIFYNYPEVYKPSDLVIEKFNQLLGAGKDEENDYRLLQWSTMLQRYAAKIWEIWTAPTESKIRFVITNNKMTEVNGFINIRTFEGMENRSNIKIDFIRWIMLRSSPGDKSPENTLLILKKTNDLWEVCGMCAKNNNNRNMKMVEPGFGNSQQVLFSCNFYLKKELIPITPSSETEENLKILASLPNIPDNTKWRILRINSTFNILEFTRNGVRIKCSELITLIKQAQKGLNTLVISNISRGYQHKSFGIYITHNHVDKVFIGPYYDDESHDIQTLRFLNNKLVTTEEFGKATGMTPNPSTTSDVWYKQAQSYESLSTEIGESVIDLTDKEEIIIHVVDDEPESAEERNEIYEIVPNTNRESFNEDVESLEKSKGSEKVDPLIIKISKRKSDAEANFSLHGSKRQKRKSDGTVKKSKTKRKSYVEIDCNTDSAMADQTLSSKQTKRKSYVEIDCSTDSSTADQSDSSKQTKRKKEKTTDDEKNAETELIEDDIVESIISNTTKQVDEMKSFIVNTSPRSLLKSTQSSRINVVNCKKTVASVEIRYFQMLKKLMVAAGITLLSFTYPVAFKVNFSNELIHGYRLIEQEKMAIFMPGCTEPHFFHTCAIAAQFLQKTFERILIAVPASFRVQVDLIEYPEYIHVLSRPVKTMQTSYFKYVHMVGSFGSITVGDFENALSQTPLLEALKACEMTKDENAFYESAKKTMKDWFKKPKGDIEGCVLEALTTIDLVNFHLAQNNINYIVNRLEQVSSQKETRYITGHIKYTARLLKHKIATYLKRPKESNDNNNSDEIICLDSDGEEPPPTSEPPSEPDQSKSNERYQAISSNRPELTITPLCELESTSDVKLSDTTIEPVKNKTKTNCSRNITKLPANLKKIAVNVFNGKVVSMPKTVKLLMLPVGRKADMVEKIDLSNFSTSTVSSMLGANLNSKQVMLTKEQLNSLKELSAKTKLTRVFLNKIDRDKEQKLVDESVPVTNT